MRNRDCLEIRCPSCHGFARFLEPFEFPSEAPDDKPFHRWGNWFVVERFPDLLTWEAPKNGYGQFLTYGPGNGGYALFHKGIVVCSTCRSPAVHVLAWPQDAWWQWSIRGKTLWAWDRSHAAQILTFVRATDRPHRPTSGPLGSIPTHFLTAKVRDTVVKAIEKKLMARG